MDEGRGLGGTAARDARLCRGAALGGAALDGAALGGAALGAAALGGGTTLEGSGCARICETPAARRKRPCLGGQVKYRSPCTEPSFLPEASSSSTPRNWPSETWISPMNRITPTRPSVVSIVWPTLNSAMMDAMRGLRVEGWCEVTALGPRW